MSFDLFRGADISASGMSAERQRMEIVANNIANAQTTQTPEGGPFRRQFLVLEESTPDPGLANEDAVGGVRVVGVESDTASFEKIYDPSHPHADGEGFVLMPNVKMPNEMIDLITASRSYEANLKALTTFKEMIEQTLSLLRGNR